MKIIAEVSCGKYICEVEKTEIEKFLNLYYDKMATIRVGDEINLGAGYDHAEDIEQAMNTTKRFIKDNQKTVNAIMNGLTITANKKVKK
jgi:hypothetical protein